MYRARVTKLLLAGTAVIGMSGAAHAQSAGQTAGTAAGTVVSNQAQASYTVNGATQTASSNVSTFVVDRKVNLTLVTDQAANTQVNLGQTGAVTTFRLTNLTNGVQDFILDPDQNNLSPGVLPGTDNFDVSNMKAYVDSNGNGVYDPGVDTRSYVDELAPDTSVAVFIVADVPTTAGANLAFVSMHVTVAAGGTAGTLGAALVATDLTAINQDNQIDIVFADGDSDGAALGDVARNGQARTYAAYEVGTRNVDLTITKSSRVISDGISAANPKALPGAVVEYCLIVRNATPLVPANNVTLTDVLPANTTFVPGSVQVGALGGVTQCLASGVPQSDATAYNAATNTIIATIPTVLGGASVAASFRVTIK